MTFGGKGNFANVGDTGVEDARRQIDLCLEAGVTLIDTADVYSDGASEEILGQALAGPARRGAAGDEGALPHGRRPQRRRALAPPRHRGLRGQPAAAGHRPHRPLPGPRVGRADADRGDAGGARAPPPTRARSATSAARTTRPGRWSRRSASPTCAACRASSATQVYYSLQERTLEHEILPACMDQGLGVARLEPAGRRPAVGQVPPRPGGPRRARGTLTDWDEPPVYDQDRLYDTIDVLVEVAEGHGVSAAQVALAWLLRRPGISTVIVGARTDEQLADNLRAADLRARRRGAGPPRGGQPAEPPLSPLAPGQDRERPPRAGRPGRPRPPPRMTGRCLCGRVRFELTEPPGAWGYCHCTRCQRRTGTAASAHAAIDAACAAHPLGRGAHPRLPPARRLREALLLGVRLGRSSAATRRTRRDERAARACSTSPRTGRRRGASTSARRRPGSRSPTTACRASRAAGRRRADRGPARRTSGPPPHEVEQPPEDALAVGAQPVVLDSFVSHSRSPRTCAAVSSEKRRSTYVSSA